MTTENLKLAIVVTTDPAQAQAGLAVVRRSLLENLAAQKDGLAAASTKLAEAQAHAQALAQALKNDGVAGESFAAWMDKASQNVRVAKDEVVAATQAMQLSRAAARENATATAAAIADQKALAIARAAANADTLAAAASRAREEAATRLAAAAQADYAAQLRRQATARDEAQSKATAFVAGLQREVDTMGLSRAEMIRYEARQQALTEGQKRLVEQFAKRFDPPKLQPVDQAGLEASNRALADSRAKMEEAARAAAVLRSAELQLQAQFRAGQVTRAQYVAATKSLKDETAGAAGKVQEFPGILKPVAAAVAGAFSVSALVDFTRKLVEANLAAEGIRRTLNFGAGGMIAGGQDMEYLRQQAKLLGLEINTAGKAFAGLNAAANGTPLAGQPVKEVFEAVAGAATVMGLSGEQAQGALLALQQMMSKGTVQAEELRGQLGERIPGAFDIAARAMGVTTAQLNKMLEDGQVLSAEFLPKFAAELKKTIAADLPDAMRATQAELNRLSNIWGATLQNIGNAGANDAVRGGVMALTALIEGLNQHVDALGGVAITAAGGLGVLGSAGVIAGISKLLPMIQGVAAAAIALAASPLGLVLLGVSAAAGGAYYGLSRMNRELEAQGAEVKKTTTLIRDMKLAMQALEEAKAPEGYKQAIREIAAAHREGKISADQAAQAVRSYVNSARTEAGNLAAAKSRFESFLPPADKVQKALKLLEADYQEMRSAGLANEAVYQLRRTKIIEESFKDQIKLQQDLAKDIAEKALTEEQRQILAIQTEKQKRITQASGNAQQIAAIERSSVQAVAVLVAEGERSRLTVVKKGAEDRVKETEAALDKSLSLERGFADQISALQGAILGRRQATDEKLRDLERKRMSATAAEADRQAEVAEKLAQADDALRAGNLESAAAAAKRAESLANLSESVQLQGETVRRVGAIEDAIDQKRIDNAEQMLQMQRQKSEELRNQLERERYEVAKVSAEVDTLNNKLAARKVLDIDTSQAMAKIKEVAKVWDEALKRSGATSIDLGGFTINADGTEYSPSTGTRVRQYRDGGRLQGPGTPTSDSLLIRASTEEFVMRASASRNIGYDVLDFMNRYGRLPPAHATGGRPGTPAVIGSQATSGSPSSAASASADGGYHFYIDNLVLPNATDIQSIAKGLEAWSKTTPLRLNTVAAGVKKG
ncbi:hypothetical protein AZSI13_32240 [Azospira sp. I13]|uniref:tape measure protein n=1 Tax=Azospira sp. I13 TaxID=1765050 RepID=UPI000D4961D2|nr:tape measure protein [Azospira sp. I13]GBG03897.1 hypothetical protein AZSI13_32240 [Azospira sp. I13]